MVLFGWLSLFIGSWKEMLFWAEKLSGMLSVKSTCFTAPAYFQLPRLSVLCAIQYSQWRTESPRFHWSLRGLPILTVCVPFLIIFQLSPEHKINSTALLGTMWLYIAQKRLAKDSLITYIQDGLALGSNPRFKNTTSVTDLQLAWI